MRNLLRGLNSHDSSICTRLYDRSRVPGTNRARSLAKCRRETAEEDNVLKLIRIEAVRVRRAKSGLEASVVQFLVREGGKRTRYVLRLVRSEKGYRIDATVPTQRLR